MRHVCVWWGGRCSRLLGEGDHREHSFGAEIDCCAEAERPVAISLHLPHTGVWGVRKVDGGEQPVTAEGSDRQA